jgi:hypothetical protein
VTLACRLIAVACLLLHSLFGCALHHACAAGESKYQASTHPLSSHCHVPQQVRQAEAHGHCSPQPHACDEQEARWGQEHDPSSSRSQPCREIADGEGLLRSGCSGCENLPCDGNESCHHSTACHYVSSGSTVTESPSVNVLWTELLIDRYEVRFESMRRDRQCANRNPASLFSGPPARCAALCTWVL